MDDFKAEKVGDEARRVLESDVYKEAWSTYRANILALIEQAKSNDTETVMHLKRLLAAASAANGHLEMLMKNGVIAANAILQQEKRSKLSQWLR